jgi:hypothetical protein
MLRLYCLNANVSAEKKMGELEDDKSPIREQDFNFKSKPVSLSKLIDYAGERLSRNLTVAEWGHYVPFQSYRKTFPLKP